MGTGAMPKKEEEKFQDNNFITLFVKIVIYQIKFIFGFIVDISFCLCLFVQVAMTKNFFLHIIRQIS